MTNPTQELIEALADNLEGHIKALYLDHDDNLQHPVFERKYKRDMEIVERARSVLSSIQPQGEDEDDVDGDTRLDGRLAKAPKPPAGTELRERVAEVLTTGVRVEVSDTDAVCRTCRGRGGHLKWCEEAKEPWPTITTLRERTVDEKIDAILSSIPGEVWRAIESAPKDGTHILLRHKSYGRTWAGHWREDSPFVNMPWIASCYDHAYPAESFDGWMPLPSPPSEEV